MKIKYNFTFLAILLMTGCSSMVKYYAGYEPHAIVEVKYDSFAENHTISSTQVGLSAHMLKDNPSFISIMKGVDSEPLAVVAMTYITSNNSFYPTYAEDKQKNKHDTSQVFTELKCDKSTGFYACRWITLVMTTFEWENIKEKLIEPAQVHLFRIHGNGLADTGIHSCQVWEVATELNRLNGIATPVKEYGGRSCYN